MRIHSFSTALLVFLFLLFNPGLHAQHVIDVGYNISLDIDVGGAHGSSLSEDNYTIKYHSVHTYVNASVSADVYFGNMDSPCKEDEWYSGLAMLEIATRIITEFNNDGTAKSSVTVGQTRKTVSHDEGSISLYSSGSGPGTAFQVSFLIMGTCARKEDSLLMGSPGISHFCTVVPSTSFASIADGVEGRSGRDPFDDNNHSWEPSVNNDKRLNGPEFAPGGESSGDEDGGSCGIYGRPDYGVNMQTLALGVNDREYFQTTAGPPVDISRYYLPQHSGVFGRGWKSTIETSLNAGPLANETDGTITIKPGRGEYLFFDYNQSMQRFTPIGNSDSLYLENDSLKWKNRDRNLLYIFGEPDSTGVCDLAAIKDVFGNTLRYAYDSPGKPSSITDDAGRKVTFQYYPDGPMSSFTTPDKRSTLYEYDESGRLVRSVDLEGLVTQFTYDDMFNITEIDFEGQKTTFTYHPVTGRGFVASLTDPGGNTYTYDLNMWTSFSQNTVNYPDGKKRIYHGDHMGNTVAVDDGTNQTWYTYDAKGRMTERKLPSWEKINYSYDAEGRLTKADWNNGLTETLAYDANGNLTEFKDRMGYLYKYSYDSKRNLKHYINPVNDTTFYSYDQKGQLVRIDHPDKTWMVFDYDAFGNLIAVSDPIGISYQAQYDPSGHFLEQLSNGMGNTVQFAYDGNRRIKAMVKPDNALVSYQYGCCGQEEIQNEDGSKTTFRRNNLNSVSEVGLTAGRTIRLQYDQNNYLKKITNPGGGTWLIKYNESFMPVVVVNPEGDSVQYAYNMNNQITSVTDERGNTTNFDYMGGMLYSFTDAKGNGRYYQRDLNDRVFRVFNARLGSMVEYEYDFRDKVTRKKLGNKVYIYGYDKAGRMILEKSGSDSTQFSYDARGFLGSIKWQNGKTFSISRNQANKPVAMNYPDGYRVEYTYDAAGMLSMVKMGSDSIVITRDAAGRIVNEKRSNSTQTNHLYNSYAELSRIEHLGHDTLMIGLDYTYTGNGNIREMDVKFPYPLQFGSVSNMTQASYNELNQLVSESGNNYSWDEDGNLVSITGNRQFFGSYTDENLADSIHYSGVGLKYHYNGLKQPVRVKKGSETRMLYYDLEDKLLFETGPEGQMLAKYIYAGELLVAWVNSAGKTYFLHHDKLGSALAATGQEGAIVSAGYFTPFGERVSSWGETSRFDFAGGFNVSNEGNGLYRMGRRLYDPRTGMFLQMDPKGMVDGTNLYAYAMSNPLVHLDPAGTDVANGTANLFTCEGPVYGDDFISEETAGVIRDGVDFGTDYIPIVGDVKSAAKAGYYFYKGEYYKSGTEAAGIGIGKYVGGKLGPKLLEALGEGLMKEAAETMVGVAVDQVVKGTSDAAAKTMDQNKSTTGSAKNSGPSNLMGPPVGIQY